jgi:hypothetical protein
LSTTTKGVSFHILGKKQAKTGIFEHLALKIGLRSSIAAVLEPDFSVFRAKMLVYFLRFFALQRDNKKVECG